MTAKEGGLIDRVVDGGDVSTPLDMTGGTLDMTGGGIAMTEERLDMTGRTGRDARRYVLMGRAGMDARCYVLAGGALDTTR